MNSNNNSCSTVGNVFKTKDYDKFKFIEGNRALNKRNYAKLVNSMKEEQLTVPIMVNENFEIIDGQHRFTAAKELNLPIYYIVQEGYGINQVKRANIVSSNWTKEDFLNMHIQDEIPSYITFGTLLEIYELNISDLLKVYSYVQDKSQSLLGKDFESGAFIDDGTDKVTEFLDALEDFKFFESYKSRQFFGAFMKLYFYPEYEHYKMLDRLKTRKYVIQKRSTIHDYLAILTKDVYSFGAVKNPIFYDQDIKKFYSTK